MSHTPRFKGLFLVCSIGLALVTRLAFAGPSILLGPMGGLAYYFIEMSILVAIFAATRLTERLNRYYDDCARRRVLEEGFMKWTAQLEAQKTAAISAALLKKAA